ncbi:MAG TPA: hypothetical protein VH558_11700 [Pseudolabrys sp.]
MREFIDPRNSQRRQSEAAVATLWLAFYVIAVAIGAATPIVSRAIEIASH